MKVYLVKIQTYTEGNFGDLEMGDLIIKGIYSTREIAQSVVDKITPVRYNAQFGSAMEQAEIEEFEIDISQ